MSSEKDILEQHGYGWKEFRTDSPVKKRKYYAPDGREMILPADAYSLSQYLGKGFTLVPPLNPIPTKEIILPAGESDSAVAVEERPDEVQMGQVQPNKTRRPYHKKRKYRRKINTEVKQ